MISDTLPCLYLLWPRRKEEIPEPVLPSGFALRVYHDADEQQLLDLLGSDGQPMSEAGWQEYRNKVLPNGLFLIEDVRDARLIATAGALHNPNPGRYDFPFGGELGYLIVAQDRRREGHGTVVCAAVVRRLKSAGYENIRVCVQEHRQPAIRLYLRLGFEPFLHSLEVEKRWQRVFAALNLRFTPEPWPRLC